MTALTPRRITVLLLALALVGSGTAIAQTTRHRSEILDPTTPLSRAHAHNDYEHDRPLLDALGHGFASVEADVWLVDGELLVAHDLEDVDPDITLESLYLEPLRRRVNAMGGSVYPGWAETFHLMVDVKSEAEPTYAALHDKLTSYANILTSFTPRDARGGAVTVTISGNRVPDLMASQPIRWAGLDGRLTDLGSSLPATLMPFISDSWERTFTWTGDGEMPAEERDRLQEIVATAHANGRRVRFWATPDEPGPARDALWQMLLAKGVDFINTDYLMDLQAFLHANDQQVSDPLVEWWPPQLRPAATPQMQLASEQPIDGLYTQGLARADGGWIFSGTTSLTRVSDDLTVQARNLEPIPTDLAAQGYNHVGDGDVSGDFVYVPLEQDDYAANQQRMAWYDAQTLEFVDSVEVTQSHAAHVAIDGDTAWSMHEFTGDTLVRYDLADWSELADVQMDETLHRVQGLDVHDGYLWISTDDLRDGVYRVDPDTGHVEFVGSMGHVEGEGEGIDMTPLARGVMHTLTIDESDEAVWFSHFRLGTPLQ